MVTDTKKVYRPNELREPYGITRDLAFKLMANGELASFKIGRARFITAEAVEEMIARKQREAGH